MLCKYDLKSKLKENLKYSEYSVGKEPGYICIVYP